MLHLQVCCDVPVGSRNTCMTEIVSDNSHISSSLQQGSGTAVSEHMGRRMTAVQCRYLLGGPCGVLFQDIGDTIACECFSSLIFEDQIIGTAASDDRKPAERLCGLTPQWA